MAVSSILVAGAGSWGTALALVLARNRHQVYLWGRDPEQIQILEIQHSNEKYLPGIRLPENIIPVADLKETLARTRTIIVAVPCSGLPALLGQLDTSGEQNFRLCLCCKGLAAGPAFLNHDLVLQVLGDSTRVAVLSGPSFAAEVAREMPTALTLACTDTETAGYFVELFHNDIFRIYTSEDITGVEVGGAVKNVMAIAAGISDGLGFGTNTRSALITRGLAEIIRLGVKLGGQPETFMGLAGLGDLVLTCTDDQSRNRRLGLALARGQSLQEALAGIGQAVEGVNTTGEVIRVAAEHAVEMPITRHVQHVLEGELAPEEAVRSLLNRDPKSESG